MHMELTLRFDCHYFDIDLELRYHLKIKVHWFWELRQQLHFSIGGWGKLFIEPLCFYYLFGWQKRIAFKSLLIRNFMLSFLDSFSLLYDLESVKKYCQVVVDMSRGVGVLKIVMSGGNELSRIIVWMGGLCDRRKLRSLSFPFV